MLKNILKNVNDWINERNTAAVLPGPTSTEFVAWDWSVYSYSNVHKWNITNRPGK
jgi:hypothetical protein